MPLFQKINDDMKTAMKSGDKARLEVIRFALAGLNAALKEKTLKEPGAALTDEEVITVLQKDAKRRKELIREALQHGWGLRELNRWLHSSTSSEDEAAQEPDSQPKVPHALATAARSFVFQVKALKSNAAIFAKRFISQIREADPAELSDATLESVEQARQDVRGLDDLFDDAIKRIQERRRSAALPRDDL